jgi:autotransporter-associated beta strand protein
MKTLGSAALLLTCCAALHWSAARATAYTWAGGDSSSPNAWAVPFNWIGVGGGIPGGSPTDTATFPIGSFTSTVVLSTNETLATITTQDSYNFTFNSQLTLSGGLITPQFSPSINIGSAGVFTLKNNSSIGSSIIANNGMLLFANQSSAASSNIININPGHLLFGDTSTAAQAVISNSGVVTFLNSSTASQASILQNGGTIDFSFMNIPITVGALSGTITAPGSIKLGIRNVAIGSLNTNMSLPDVISGNGAGLSKVGTGTLHLRGSNTYTGPTTVLNGTLDVSGSIIGTIVVSTGATLTGSGSVGSASNAGALIPNGMLTINGSLLDSASAITNLSVNATGNSGVLFVTGAATLDGMLHIGFPGGPPPHGTTYVLLDSSGITGTFAACTSDLPGAGTLSYGQTQITFATPYDDDIFLDKFETPVACN